MKIYINGKEVKTNQNIVTPEQFMRLAGHQQLCPEALKYNFRLEINDNFYDDVEVDNNRIIELKDGQKFKLFPKAGMSHYGPYY